MPLVHGVSVKGSGRILIGHSHTALSGRGLETLILMIRNPMDELVHTMPWREMLLISVNTTNRINSRVPDTSQV